MLLTSRPCFFSPCLYTLAKNLSGGIFLNMNDHIAPSITDCKFGVICLDTSAAAFLQSILDNPSDYQFNIVSNLRHEELDFIVVLGDFLSVVCNCTLFD